MKRVLLVAATTGYQTRMFEEAAMRLGVDLVYATDRCDRLDDPWRDGAIAVRFRDDEASVAAVLGHLAREGVDGVVAVGDRPAVLAARVQHRLGLPGHPPDAAAIARDKGRQRARLRQAGLPVPEAVAIQPRDHPTQAAGHLTFPVVVKPTALSGSRGVIRADDDAALVDAVARIRRLLESPDVRAAGDDNHGLIQVERYIDGREYALEGLMTGGTLRTLAVFDKPDPLEGPFFEETIYVTPSRAGHAVQRALEQTVGAACAAIGLRHGPIHAECRVEGETVYVLEVAARPIGGLCARALRFVRRRPEADDDMTGLEELLLRHACGEDTGPWTREPGASGVMMIPIPRGGVFRRVDGADAARATPGIDEVVITAKPDQRLVPLPEGASYLGFIFARDADPAGVERALRRAHDALRFTIDPYFPVATVNPGR